MKMASRTNQQAVFPATNGPYTEAVQQPAACRKLLETLVENDGRLVLDEGGWRQLVGHINGTTTQYGGVPTLIDTLTQCKHIFKYVPQVQYQFVGGSTLEIRSNVSLQLCKDHCTQQGCSDRRCAALHCCKFFLLGQCKYNTTCRFGHDLNAGSNFQLLQHFLMDRLLPHHVGLLLRWSSGSSSELTVPQICKHYNHEGGCRRGTEGIGCLAMHVCSHYIAGDCKFGARCKRSHNIYENQPKFLLKKYGIDVQRPPSACLDELRKIMSQACGVMLPRASSEGAGRTGFYVPPINGGMRLPVYMSTSAPMGMPIRAATVGHHFPTPARSVAAPSMTSGGIFSTSTTPPGTHGYGMPPSGSSSGYGSAVRDPFYAFGMTKSRSTSPEQLGGTPMHHKQSSSFHRNRSRVVSPSSSSSASPSSSRSSSPVRTSRQARRPSTPKVSISEGGRGASEVAGRLPSRQASRQRSSSRARSASRVRRRLISVDGQPKVVEIIDVCVYHLRGCCSYGPDCFNYHSQQGLPYQWQWSMADRPDDDEDVERDSWQDFGPKSNKSIEKNFRVASNSSTEGKLGDNETVTVDFGSMKFSGRSSGQKLSGRVRRLGTESAAEPSTSKLKCHFATTWRWYELRDGEWMASEISEKLELGYLSNCGGKFHVRGTDDDVVDFPQMQLVEKKRKKASVVTSIIRLRRRPVFSSNDETETAAKTSSSSSSSIVYPSYWDRSLEEDTINGFIRIPVAKGGATAAEYRKISKIFDATMKDHGATIKSLSRIQNRDLYEDFSRHLDRLERKRGGTTPTVRQLFHGTSAQYVDAICQQGFDWRVAGMSVGTKFGRGSYFASDAGFASKYCCTRRKLFVVKVIVGDSTAGKPDYVRPPAKDSSLPLHQQEFYDSCVDKVADPSIFVVFEKHQCYPEYMIEF